MPKPRSNHENEMLLERIRSHIRQSGLTDAKIGAELGFKHRSQIATRLHGTTAWSPDNIKNLCRVLGLAAEECAELLELAGYVVSIEPQAPAERSLEMGENGEAPSFGPTDLKRDRRLSAAPYSTDTQMPLNLGTVIHINVVHLTAHIIVSLRIIIAALIVFSIFFIGHQMVFRLIDGATKDAQARTPFLMFFLDAANILSLIAFGLFIFISLLIRLHAEWRHRYQIEKDAGSV